MNEAIKQKIRERAFEIYEGRLQYNEKGTALGDWLEAEAEILEKISNKDIINKLAEDWQ